MTQAPARSEEPQAPIAAEPTPVPAPAMAECPPMAEEIALAKEPAAAEANAPAEGPALAHGLAQEAEAAGPLGFGELQKSGQAQLEAASAVAASLAESLQAIVVEATDYSQKSLQNRLGFYEKLRGAKTLQSAIEIQSEYAKTSCAGFVAEAAKMRELYSDLAKVAFRPLQAAITVVQGAKA